MSGTGPTSPPRARVTGNVIGMSVDAIDMRVAAERVLAWAAACESRYVCVANAHVAVTCRDDAALRAAVAGADMVTPDGAPLVWMLRRTGHRSVERVDGPTLMLRICEAAAERGIGIYLYGSTPDTLERLQRSLAALLPGLRIAGAESPPFRPLTAEEDDAAVERINGSGAQVVFVGLGAPRQEAWMAAHRGRVGAVMLGVGAAFDYHAGNLRRAPAWMQRAGLEWLYRLAQEPRRLWRRYLVTNTLFVAYTLRQALRARDRVSG